MGTAREGVMKARKPRWVCPNGCKITRVKSVEYWHATRDCYYKVTDLELGNPTSTRRLSDEEYEDTMGVYCPKCDSDVYREDEDEEEE